MSITPQTDAVHSGLDDALSPVPQNEMDQSFPLNRECKSKRLEILLRVKPYHPKPEQEHLLHLPQALLFVRLVSPPHPFEVESGKLEYHIIKMVKS